MALKLSCDCCDCPVKDADAETIGRYDPIVCCVECAAKVRALEAAERALHADLVRDFEAKRADLRADAKAKGLARLPDEE